MARKMKDSGVEWIGEIPIDWEITKIKNEMEFINGYAFDSNSLKSSGKYSVIRIGDIVDGTINVKQANKIDYDDNTLEKYIIKDNDVIVAMSGATVGKLGYVNRISDKCYINQRVGIIRSQISRYIFYYLSTGEFLKYINLLAAGSAQPNISTESINNYFISIPSSQNEIKKISDFLDEKVGEIDSVIIKTKETIEDYKKYKQAIINKIIENEKGSKYKFRYLGELKNGLNYHSTVEKESIKFLGVGNFKDFMILNKRESFSDLPLDMELPSEYLLKNGDIIFVRSNGSKDLVGRSVMVDNVDYNLTYSGFCIRFRNKHIKLVGNKYLLYFFRSESFKQLLYIGSNGMAINNLSQDILNSVKIPIPSVKRQEEIVAYLDEKCSKIEKLIAKKEELLVDLENYKKSLIYEYVTGKKEVE